MLLCDTSGLLAYFDAGDAHHARVAAAVDGDPGPFVVSPFVLAELDYLLATRRGVDAEMRALAEIGGGAWDLPQLTAADLAEAVGVIDRYRDQEIGLADASLVVLARRLRSARVLTLDHRHFRVLQTAEGAPFEVIPA